MTRSRPRAAFVAAVPETVEKILIHDLRRLRDRLDITIVCSDGDTLGAIQAEGFRVLSVPIERKLAPLADTRSLARLVPLFRRERFDVVHTYGPKAGLLGQTAGALAGIPVRIHSCRGLLYTPGMPTWKRRLLERTDRITYGLATRAIFISNADQQFCVAHGLCDARKARYTGSGVDLAYFDPAVIAPGTRNAVRADLGVRPDDVVILTIGRYVRDKGYVELARALHSLGADAANVHLIWIAPAMTGEDGVLPHSLPTDAGIGDRVRMMPIQRDVRPFYAAADALVHPSYREGVPRVLMEAAAMKLPILASDIPGCREVIPDEQFGTLFAARSIEALADAMRRFLANRDAAVAAADRLATRVAARFDQQTLGERIWDVYRELGFEP